jgi:hypothetical protein
MTNKKLRQRERKQNNKKEVINNTEDTSNEITETQEIPLKQLGDLSRTNEKKSKDRVRKNNREDKFISLGI